ncbi:cytochrome c peroxidase, partial [Aliarcobacter butzleri]
MKNLRLFFIVGVMFSALMAEDMKKEDLGRMLFFDVNLSKNRTQSCATCHNPNA